MPVLITGVAGFIGYHVARRLCEAGIEVTGIDNLDAYYSVKLKLARLQRLFGFAHFRFHTLDITHPSALPNHNKTTGDRATAAVAAQALPLGQAWCRTFTAMALVWFARGFVESLKEGRNPHIARADLCCEEAGTRNEQPLPVSTSSQHKAAPTEPHWTNDSCAVHGSELPGRAARYLATA